MREFLGSAATAMLGDIFWVGFVLVSLVWTVNYGAGTPMMALVGAACPALGAIIAGLVTGSIDGLRRSGVARAALSRVLTPGAAMALGIGCVPCLVAVVDQGVAPGFGEIFIVVWAVGVVVLGAVTAGASSVAVTACRDQRREPAQ
jgi:hypothetical protein